jgi:putative membrane protein
VSRVEGAGSRAAGLWFGILGGLVAWIAHLGTSYALVPWVCATGRIPVLHGLTVLMALVAAAATLVAARRWRGAGTSGTPPEAGARVPVERHRLEGFLGLFGLILSGFFLVLILVEGLPALLDPSSCDAVPTLDRPIVRVEPVFLAAGFPVLSALHLQGLVAPGGVWTSWNPDPWILSVLLGLGGLYVAGVRRLWREAGRERGLPRWRVGSYVAGMWVLVLALVSPVDALGETLFSAHMVQHMLLMVVAAPLLVLGRPVIAYLWALPAGWRRAVASGPFRSMGVRRGWTVLSHPLTVLVLHVAALWAWHVPALYQAALGSPLLHGLEHASYLFTAMLFWWTLSRAGRMGRWPGYGAGMLYVFGAALQSGALGALLLFARTPWFPAHAPGAELWGVDLLVDQQVAAALMWIPAGLVYTAAMLVLFVAWLRKADRAASHRERHGWSRFRWMPEADEVTSTRSRRTGRVATDSIASGTEPGQEGHDHDEQEPHGLRRPPDLSVKHG